MSPVRVAVVDPSPTYHRGLQRVLSEAGFAAEEPDDLLAWPAEGPAAVIIGLQSQGETTLLADFHQQQPHVPVVALLPVCDAEDWGAAIRAGASTTVLREGPIDSIVAALRAALEGQALVSLELARKLAARLPAKPPRGEFGLRSLEFSNRAAHA